MLYNQPQQPNYSKKTFIEPAHTPCGQLLRPVPRSRLPAAPPAAPQAPGAFPASPPQGSCHRPARGLEARSRPLGCTRPPGYHTGTLGTAVLGLPLCTGCPPASSATSGDQAPCAAPAAPSRRGPRGAPTPPAGPVPPGAGPEARGASGGAGPRGHHGNFQNVPPGPAATASRGQWAPSAWLTLLR